MRALCWFIFGSCVSVFAVYRPQNCVRSVDLRTSPTWMLKWTLPLNAPQLNYKWLNCTLQVLCSIWKGYGVFLYIFIAFKNVFNFTTFLPAADCPVDTNPSSAFVEYGDSFKANCSRLSDQVDGMGWESSLGGVSLKQGVSFVLLNIPVVNQWDFSPGCFVNLVDDNQCERLVAMTVYSK